MNKFRGLGHQSDIYFIYNNLISNLITFPSISRRGGPGSGFVRAGIRFRAGVVYQLLS